MQAMIIADLTGGLGNQMFIYAAARAAALRHNVPLKLNIAGFVRYKLHHYALSNLNIQEDFATAEDLTDILATGRIYREGNPYGFDRNVLETPPPMYLRGYFQSFRYVEPITDVIRSDFSVRTPAEGQDATVLSMIAETNAVCLHVRRADYVSNPGTQQHHGICPREYYEGSLSHLRNRVGPVTLFVFSDDIYWAQANLKLDAPTIFVGHNRADRNYEDLRLMSACRHFIIANSSFSWWAAWLGAAQDKVVYAPARWLNHGLDTRDLIPPSWTQVRY